MPAAKLTPTEAAIVDALKSGAWIGRTALCDLAGVSPYTSTLSVHIANIRAKLGAGHIRSARYIGYRWEPHP